MSRCAYCGSDGSPTREHVIPAFLYEYQKDSQDFIGWSEPAQKMIRSELQVKDVCAGCNNGVLSELDDYGKRVLTENGILTSNFVKPDLLLSYQYDPLVRWLLKVSFNSSRMDRAHSPLFERFIPYILGSGPRPLRSGLAVLAYLSKPTVFDGDAKVRLQKTGEADDRGRSTPFLVRLSWGQIPGQGDYTIRINILGATVFFLLIFAENTFPGHAAAGIRAFQKINVGAKELSANRSKILLVQGERSWVDMFKDQTARQRAFGAPDA